MSDIAGKDLDKPLTFNGVAVKVSDMGIIREPYPLEKHEFDLLISNKSSIKDWRNKFLQIGIGVSITIGSKIIFIGYQLLQIKSIEEKNAIDYALKPWEVISFLICLIVYLLLAALVKWGKKDKRDQLIKKLEPRFNY